MPYSAVLKKLKINQKNTSDIYVKRKKNTVFLSLGKASLKSTHSKYFSNYPLTIYVD